MVVAIVDEGQFIDFRIEHEKGPFREVSSLQPLTHLLGDGSFC